MPSPRYTRLARPPSSATIIDVRNFAVVASILLTFAVPGAAADAPDSVGTSTSSASPAPPTTIVPPDISASQRAPAPTKAWHAARPNPGPPPEAMLASELGQSRAARRIVGLIARLRNSVRDTKYQGRTKIRAEDGYYAWDCSGMSNWILQKTARRARAAFNKSRPVARDYFHMIDKSSTKRTRRGWKKLAHVSEARPGDLFTWLRSPMSRSKATGHVGFFAETPLPHPEYPNIYLARIVDSTSYPHGDDTRQPDGIGGFGFGTMAFVVDETGETIAYGWHGHQSLEWGFMPARVVFGRAMR